MPQGGLGYRTHSSPQFPTDHLAKRLMLNACSHLEVPVTSQGEQASNTGLYELRQDPHPFLNLGPTAHFISHCDKVRLSHI